MRNAAVSVFHDLVTFDDVGALQPHFAVRFQAEELLGRFFHKIVGIDPEFFGEHNVPHAHFGVLGMVLHGQYIPFVFIPIAQDHLKRMQHRHQARCPFAQIVAYAVFKQRMIHDAVGL